MSIKELVSEIIKHDVKETPENSEFNRQLRSSGEISGTWTFANGEVYTTLKNGSTYVLEAVAKL